MKASNLLLALFFTGLFPFVVSAAEPGFVPTPRVDERVELLGIVFRLAGIQEYQCEAFKQYDDDIQEHFGKMKNHAAILSAQILRRMRGVGYNAVVDFGVHLTIRDGHVELSDENSGLTLDGMDSRWTKEAAVTFAKVLDDFYVESRFHEFFESHQELYGQLEKRFTSISEKIDYGWFEKFYGVNNLENFRLILCLTSESNNYGGTCKYRDGRETYFAFIGESGPELPINDIAIIHLIVHEFSHSFCNPLVKKYREDLLPRAEKLFPFIRDAMEQQNYTTPEIVWCECLVRSCENRYLRTHEYTEFADQLLSYQEQCSFVWLDILVEELARYEKERDRFPTLDSFMPEIVKLQDAVISDEFLAELQRKEEARPKVVSTIPELNAKNVDPALEEISVTFDQPMQTWSCAWCTMDGGKTFPKLVEPKVRWSDDKKTCIMGTVKLEPGKTYNIHLNSPGNMDFVSEEDAPLEPVPFSFTTKEE